MVYHVLNRANGRLPLFEKDGDYEAFERVLRKARDYCDVPLLAYCVMPNHWHLIVRPRGAGIGLYLCRQIIDAHGGSIRCEAGVNGHGTRIRIVLDEEAARLVHTQVAQ